MNANVLTNVPFSAYDHDVLHARKFCHPDFDQYITIQVDDAIISMEGLCHHTAQRIMMIPGEYFFSIFIAFLHSC